MENIEILVLLAPSRVLINLAVNYELSSLTCACKYSSSTSGKAVVGRQIDKILSISTSRRTAVPTQVHNPPCERLHNLRASLVILSRIQLQYGYTHSKYTSEGEKESLEDCASILKIF